MQRWRFVVALDDSAAMLWVTLIETGVQGAIASKGVVSCDSGWSDSWRLD